MTGKFQAGESEERMRQKLGAAIAGAAIGLIAAAGGAGAQSLAPNQTAAFAFGRPFIFTYTENYDCVEQPTDDLNFNNVPAESDPAELQIPICQVTDEPPRDPTGAKIQSTDKLYVLVPMFDHNGVKDTNPNDAIACDNTNNPYNDPNENPGMNPNLPVTLCGADLGNALISLFGTIPEAYKQNPAVAVQCPAPGDPPGSCTMHASRLDLGPALHILTKGAVPANTNVFTPTPNHSHVINTDAFQRRPVWWQVVTELVTNEADWPSADGSSGITSVRALRAAQKSGDVIGDVPTNFFLFFGSQPVRKAKN